MRLLSSFALFALACDPSGPPPPPPPPPPPIAPATAVAHDAATHPLRPSWEAIVASEVPQVPNRFGLFHDAPPVERERFDDGLLVCDIRVSREAGLDTFKGPDLSLDLRAGPHPVRRVHGAEDTWGDVLSYPVRTLATGDSIWLRVVDRDVWHDEYAGSATEVYRGQLPLVFRREHFVVECRGLPSEQVELRVSERLAHAASAFTRLERAPGPTVSREDLGYPSWERDAAVGAARQAAAWVDWDDPRVAALGARLTELDRRWEERARAEVIRATESLPAAETWVPFGIGMQARVVESACGIDASRIRAQLPFVPFAVQGVPCLARVEIARAGDRPRTLAPVVARPASLDLRVIDAEGHTHDALPIAYERDGQVLPPEASVTLDGTATIVAVIPIPEDARILVRREATHPFLARVD